ncbi:MAG: hypothetical protein ACE5EM_10645 [Sphingomonadales bacterium]
MPLDPNQTNNDAVAAGEKADRGFHPLKILIPVVAVLVTVTLYANWYSSGVSEPRYCDDRENALHRLERILTEGNPAGTGANFKDRRPYLIAAKLLFLIPRQPDEEIEPYLDRVREHFWKVCR